jgi:hypothetical protein
MKTLAVLLMAMLVADTLTACGSGTTSAAVTEPPAQTQITGVTTPQSVAVVTAN